MGEGCYPASLMKREHHVRQMCFQEALASTNARVDYLWHERRYVSILTPAVYSSRSCPLDCTGFFIPLFHPTIEAKCRGEWHFAGFSWANDRARGASYG